jgi:hypothetical protein
MQAKDSVVDRDELARGAELPYPAHAGVTSALAETRRDLRVARDFRRCVPRLTTGANAVASSPLEEREGYVLARIDGVSTVEAIIESIVELCSMSAEETLATLANLRERRLIVVR